MLSYCSVPQKDQVNAMFHMFWNRFYTSYLWRHANRCISEILINGRKIQMINQQFYILVNVHKMIICWTRCALCALSFSTCSDRLRSISNDIEFQIDCWTICKYCIFNALLWWCYFFVYVEKLFSMKYSISVTRWSKN